MEHVELLSAHWHALNLDFVNSLYEVFGGFFALNHCRVLYADKVIRGTSLLSVIFFTSWGFFNLFYYTSLDQALSRYGAAFMLFANFSYVMMILYYKGFISLSVLPFLDDEALYLAPEKEASESESEL